MSDSNQDDFINRQRDTRISDMVGAESIGDNDLITIVQNGTNKKLTKQQLLSSLGITGTISQDGASTGTPILDVQGSDNKIRNIENGPGVQATVSAENGVTIEHNFLQDSGGIAILRDISEQQPTFLSLTEGSGIDLQLAGNNLTIAATGTLPATKVVTVNAESDFPTAVGGIITLEDDTAYFMANNVTTANRFVLGVNSAVVGASPNVAKLEYSGTGTMFTAVDKRVDFRNALFSCPTGQFLDISETGGGNTILFAMDSCVVEACTTFGTFDSLFAVNINNSSALNCTQGASFTGTGWTLVSFNRFGIGSTSASFIGVDLGSITADGIEFNNLLAVGVAGAVGINGLASSGNITTGNLGTVVDCNFVGAITPETNIDAANAIRWQSSGNDGIEDTRPNALVYMVGNATATTISTINTPVKVAGTFTIEEVSIFTADNTGRVTYAGERDFKTPVDITTSVVAVSGGTIDITLYLAINGSIVAGTAKPGTVSSSDKASVTIVWQYTFQENDYAEIWIENNSNTTDLIVESAVQRES